MQLEGLWWLLTIIGIVLVMLPVWKEVGVNYNYHRSNILAVFIFITFTRLIFVLRHSYMARNVAMKAIFIVLCIPLFLYFMDRLNDFQTFIDENGYTALLPGSSGEATVNLAKYIRYEYIFFVVGALITVAILPFRMIISLWRTHNRGTV